MSTPPINVTPASPDTNASGITNRRLSYQPADAGSGPHHRQRSSVQYAPSHLRTGSVPYVPDAPSRWVARLARGHGHGNGLQLQ